MVTGALINAKVAYGFAKAGAALGFPYSWYRPSANTSPLDAGNLQGTITAYITTDASLRSSIPPNDAKSVWYGAYDTTLTQAGDYFVGALGTYFIASEFLPSPPSLVFCNSVVTVTRPVKDTPGPRARFGSNAASMVIAKSFPAWVKSAERRTNPELQQPGDVPLPSANILLPQSITQQIIRGDVLTTGDTIPAIYNVQSADLLFNCWNIVALKAGG